MPDATDNRLILTPSQLNRDVRTALEQGFPLLWVEGEISNLARPRSGHVYFSLKDAAAQVRCAMWRNRSQLLRFEPTDGMQVLVRARISLYEPRGEYQLIVEHMEEAGFGALQRAFELLKAKLEAEGLFAAERKRPLPTWPRKIGVVTSPTGAAVRDITATLARRFPGVQVLLFPVQVQGDKAPAEITQAIGQAQHTDCDVLIVGRGGGSLEDLWAFNDEGVARAIVASRIPVISAVGHEVDFTIADFVADMRAPTPTAAAELAAPNRDDWLATLTGYRDRLLQQLRATIRQQMQRLGSVERQLQLLHPKNRLAQQSQRLDELEQRLQSAAQQQLRTQQSAVNQLHAQLNQHNPQQRLRYYASQQAALTNRLQSTQKQYLKNAQQQITSLMRALHAVSPLATLDRGYAIVKDESGTVLLNSGKVKTGEQIEARLAKGSLQAKVTWIRKV